MGRRANREYEHGFGGDLTERRFSHTTQETGLEVLPSPSIRAPYPVADRYGNVKKVVTHPDFLVRDSDAGLESFVEITTSSGDLPAKEAQRRVVAAAGIENYVVLTGDDVDLLEQTFPPEVRKQLLFWMFGW